MAKVLITPNTLVRTEGPHLRLLREAGLEPAYPPRAGLLSEEEIMELLPGAVAVIAGSEPYTRRVFAAAPTLRVVARAGVGYDAVDLQAATEHGVAVTITPGANHEAVAEHTMGFILALAKDLRRQDLATRAGQWPRHASIHLRGQTLGIIGLGRIGKSVARRAAAFRMRLVAYEPFPDNEFVKELDISLLPFDDVLKQADFVTLHVPLSRESRHLINARTLSLMKPTAFLINTARGGLVCERDLLQALRAKKLAGAGLDVFENEPARDHPLFQLDNIIVTAHTAGIDRASLEAMGTDAARSIISLLRGEWPEGVVVNAEVRDKFRPLCETT
ncbi:MAG: hypothetical protein KatS3mg105_3364 [Gemmatales bacterium]|nr:MAG: hypothetical protein KatS3mg105_3364 [Gemmatales bacterium]